MSAMIYYDELLYLFLYMCNFLTIFVCMSISIGILVWCIRKIKEFKNE